MSTTKTFYVALGMRVVMKGGKIGRQVPASFVAEAGSRDGMTWRDMVMDNTVAVYEVECAAKSEPVDILVRWLATGRPRIMAVRELWTVKVNGRQSVTP